MQKYLSIEYWFNKITNIRIMAPLCVLVLFILLLMSRNSLMSMNHKEELLENYMIKTYQEWYVNTAVGFTSTEDGITHFRGYFISDPEDEVRVDYINNSEYSKYYWSNKKSEPVYGEYISNIVNRYFEVLNYTIYFKRGNSYQHFIDGMNMDEIIAYLKDNDLEVYISGNIVIDSQDSSTYEFENMCKVLYNDLMDEDIHFDFDLRGILVNGTPVEARFQNVKWRSTKSGVTFKYINVNEKQDTLTDVEASIDDIGEEVELKLDEESQLDVIDKLDEDRNEIGPGIGLDKKD